MNVSIITQVLSAYTKQINLKSTKITFAICSAINKQQNWIHWDFLIFWETAFFSTINKKRWREIVQIKKEKEIYEIDHTVKQKVHAVRDL